MRGPGPGAECVSTLPLLHIRPGLALLALDGVKHDLVGVVLLVAHETLAPVVANGVGEDVAAAVESRGRDAAAHGGIPFEAVLGVLVPEVEGTITAGGTESAMLGVERDIIYGVDLGGGALRWIPVALEREVGAIGFWLVKGRIRKRIVSS